MIANEYRNVAMRYLSGLQAYLTWAESTGEDHPCGSCAWIAWHGPDCRFPDVDPGYEGWGAAHSGYFGQRAKNLVKVMEQALARFDGNSAVRRLYVHKMIGILREELAEPCHA
jgi:hypothetical protein